ncbi:MAG: hypothetical protein V2A63_02905 [Patescibacteria group bacterium]
MILKTSKFLATLFALALILVFSNSAAWAATTTNTTVRSTACSSEADCKAKLEPKAKEKQALDDLSQGYQECVQKTSDGAEPGWFSVVVNGVEKNCADIVSEAQSKSGKSLSKEVVEKLGDLRTKLGAEINQYTTALTNYKTVNVSSLLSVKGQTTSKNLESFLNKTIDFLVKMVGLAAFLFLLAGGLRLLLSGGNDNEVQKSKTMITYSIIGLAVALLAYIIVAAVQGILYR